MVVTASRIRQTLKTMLSVYLQAWRTRVDHPRTSACVRLRCHPCVLMVGPSTLMLMAPKACHHAFGCLQQLRHGLPQARAARQAGICSRSSQHQHPAACSRSQCRWCKMTRVYTSAAHKQAQQRKQGVSGRGWTAPTRAIWLVVMAPLVAACQCGEAVNLSECMRCCLDCLSALLIACTRVFVTSGCAFVCAACVCITGEYGVGAFSCRCV